MAASAAALVLRTGDDAGTPNIGARKDPSNVPIYIQSKPLTSGTLSLTTTIGASQSIDFLLQANAVGSAFPTGQETLIAQHSMPLRSWFPLVDLWAPPTGYGWMLTPVLCASVAEGDAEELDETDEPFVALAHHGVRIAALEVAPEADAAARIRELSGLETEKLANLLGVTRTAFYDWLRGVKPRGKRRDHLLQVAHLVEDAARRLGEPRAVAAWLMTPSQASNRIPFELAREHQYDLARSLLTRRSRAALPKRARTTLDRAELRSRVDSITSRPAPEDYEDTADE